MQEIEGLDSLVNLQSLFLGKNKISEIKVTDYQLLSVTKYALIGARQAEEIEGAGTASEQNHCLVSTMLFNQPHTYLQSNRITVLKGLGELTSLEELYLDHNGVEVIEGLDNNVGVRLQCP